MFLPLDAKVRPINYQLQNKTARQDYFPSGSQDAKKSIRSLLCYQRYLKIELIVNGFVAQAIKKRTRTITHIKV